MPTLLLGRRLVDLGMPAPAELLDGGDVDGAVVQEVLDLGQLGGQEAPVRADGVPGQGTVRARAMCPSRRPGSWRRRRPGSASTPPCRPGGPIGCAWPDDVVHGRPTARAWRGRPGRDLLPTMVRSSSVTRQAISTMVWRAGSSPVISRSIQASMRGMLPVALDGRRAGGALYCPAMLRVPLHQLDPELAVPAYARDGRCRRGPDGPPRRGRALRGGRAVVPTGVAVAIPDGLRRTGPAPQRAGRSPRRHLPQHAGPDRLRLPGRGPGRPGQPRSRAGLRR